MNEQHNARPSKTCTHGNPIGTDWGPCSLCELEENTRLRRVMTVVADRTSDDTAAQMLRQHLGAAHETSDALWRWEPGVMHFHSQDALRERFYHVVNDLREAGCVVDLWLNDIAKVLTEYGYDMTIKRRGALKADEQ